MMFRVLATVFAGLCAGPCLAQSCPEFFRFVDFGLQSRDGALHRGGAIFRAESFDGRPLLDRPATQCLAVRDVARDGRGNPIPVVSAVSYDPDQTGLELRELHVMRVEDATDVAVDSAQGHQSRLESVAVQKVQGAAFLCVFSSGDMQISCQLESPYGGTAPLVVYCGGARCDMPAMAINAHILVRAVWHMDGVQVDDPLGTGHAILERVRQIHGFLTPLSSGL